MLQWGLGPEAPPERPERWLPVLQPAFRHGARERCGAPSGAGGSRAAQLLLFLQDS